MRMKKIASNKKKEREVEKLSENGKEKNTFFRLILIPPNKTNVYNAFCCKQTHTHIFWQNGTRTTKHG